jgi:hypothetical protein
MTKIFVKRGVYDGARELERVSINTEATPHFLAEELIKECRNVGNKTGERFWRDVWLYLMMVKYVPGSVAIIEDKTPQSDLSPSLRPAIQDEIEKPINSPSSYTIN